MFQPEKFSDYLSIFAVVLSSFSLFLSWKNYMRDRSHLTLKMMYKKVNKEFQLLVTNDGRRIAVLQEVNALLWISRTHTITTTTYELAEGKQKTYSVPLAMFPGISNPFRVRGFVVMDTRGNSYRVTIFKIYWKILFQN